MVKRGSLSPSLKRLSSCCNLIRKLAKGSKKERNEILANASPKLIHTLQEIAYNTILKNGSVKVKKKSDFQKLKRSKKNILKFINTKRIPINKARKGAVQIGGALPILATLAAPLIDLVLDGISKLY